MRILYVCLDPIPVGAPNGAGVHMLELLRGFEANGHETALAARFLAADYVGTRRIYVQSRDFRRDDHRSPGMRIVGGGTPTGAMAYAHDTIQLLRGPRLQRFVYHAIRDFEPDLIYERHALFRVEGVVAARTHGIPHMLEVNAPLAHEAIGRGLRLVRVAGSRERRAWRATDVVVALNAPLAERVRAVGQPSVVVVPTGVDIKRFGRSDGSDVRHRLALEERFVVGWIGSMNPWHDLSAIVDAVAALPQELKASLLVVGGGPLEPDIEARALSRHVDARFVGPVPPDQVPNFVAAMDVGVCGLAAWCDWGSPMKVLEYMAGAKPTVVSTVGDLAALVHEGVAVSYPPGDSSKLAECLAALATDPNAATKLGACGRTFVEARTWQSVARTIVGAAPITRTNNT